MLKSYLDFIAALGKLYIFVQLFILEYSLSMLFLSSIILISFAAVKRFSHFCSIIYFFEFPAVI